jgi:hypothetical protein
VSAVTSVGWGTAAAASHLVSDVPLAPQNVSVSGVSLSAIAVRAAAPDARNSPLTAYTVRYAQVARNLTSDPRGVYPQLASFPDMSVPASGDGALSATVAALSK